MAKPKDRPQEVEVIDDLQTIPGLGIIRIRALRKAGFTCVAELKKVELAQLLAVPGLTEIKANQILDFLHPKRVTERELAKPLAIAPEVQQVAKQAGELLAVDTGKLDEKLSRQLARWVSLADHLPEDAVVAGKDQVKAKQELAEARKALEAIRAEADLKRKRQDRFAEQLREPRRRLEKLVRV